ncbi:Phosphate starvation-inducible protein PhoH, predicted ATPase [Bathymodiolus heckerae thiotrophic gill symbiont]|uniref:PhoH family protein n=1 Tax=Bathymodiolus heckerae thiotrophic gill symbiont TaxID=1052212 RepID=UPI0010B6D0CE|nr:PhoH family protein [Bathymodiolus heckerae thiotrophic gill symbiont]CAC9435124.1 Phosphate starvation-inducible protein PhoH, predicted ATPase [uncultured Gammaproteobacteria bacterium]SMN12741.1 Phosphate starvation-inducible protein PhoH, predicted ATPase [Bathymodiolus heckerae thiotrophic gill symbiont]SMN14490.1 Phosphate starvation-inducible protein PhoH, predicted ATPase [uncultured Candidatus Thioglobus sp.]
MNLTLEISSSEQLASICGSFDRHLETIAKSLEVEISNKGEDFVIQGDNQHIAARVLQGLATLGNSQTIEIHDVEMAIKACSHTDLPEQMVNIKTKRKFIHIRSKNQQKYALDIQKKDCTFGIGPAGTGKTYLAVARAVEALERSDVRRIVLVRPAVEAGEKLGFLPGDMNEKVDPYLRPIYDALYEMLGFDKVEKLLNKNIIEVAPLAFMRGRTLNESFIILDEAQNTTIPQMKMFLTRLGFGSKMVITGDVTQIDLANPKQSGLIHVAKVLAHEDKISFCYFETKDVVRHNLVQRIVSAYEKFK